MNTPKFSIVVNTLNRGKLLQDTLLSLAGLDWENFEVIVVNGPSTDNTQSIIDSWDGKIKTARCSEANLSMSRNIGIEQAAGDIVAFIDDDAAPHPAWLRELARPYADSKVGAVGGFTIDNTGVRFQARKTLCDRFGNAHSVSPFFDERPLNATGTPFYPSLLGTNSSFRRSALCEIGGFDHTFAYYLDETDVCLRIVDNGYEIHYAPKAIVFHQFAESNTRSAKRIPKTLYPSVVSKSYFIMRHGSRLSLRMAADELESYRSMLNSSNKWLCDNSEISSTHRVSLDQDVEWGIEHGKKTALERWEQPIGDLAEAFDAPPFKTFPVPSGLRIVFVSQSFPPFNEAGIARWTSMMADGLAQRGHKVHVLARAPEQPSVTFKDGYWLHLICPEPGEGEFIRADLDLPPNIADWTAAVKREIGTLKSFGVDVVSFPIWDAEGAAIATETDYGVVMSLHTSYGMAKPFKPEWDMRPLYNHFMVEKMIKQERRLLQEVPVILANSNAIIDDLTAQSGEYFKQRTIMAPHGTFDPLEQKPQRKTFRSSRAAKTFEVVYVGRFEPRKGIDIAARSISTLLKTRPEARATFIGDTLSERNQKEHFSSFPNLMDANRVQFLGHVSREKLDDVYASCDVVLMPSRYESFGLVAIEAMAAGAPVITLKTGGLKEVVTNGVTGYLVDVNGSETETCTSHLLSLAKDPTLTAKLGNAARSEFEKRFTIDSMLEIAERAYIKAAQKRELNVSQC